MEINSISFVCQDRITAASEQYMASIEGQSWASQDQSQKLLENCPIQDMEWNGGQAWQTGKDISPSTNYVNIQNNSNNSSSQMPSSNIILHNIQPRTSIKAPQYLQRMEASTSSEDWTPPPHEYREIESPIRQSDPNHTITSSSNNPSGSRDEFQKSSLYQPVPARQICHNQPNASQSFFTQPEMPAFVPPSQPYQSPYGQSYARYPSYTPAQEEVNNNPSSQFIWNDEDQWTPANYLSREIIWPDIRDLNHTAPPPGYEHYFLPPPAVAAQFLPQPPPSFLLANAPPSIPPSSVVFSGQLPGHRLHACPNCTLWFPNRTILNAHLSNHDPAKLFVCNVPCCNARFKDEAKLVVHLRGHLGHIRCDGEGGCNMYFMNFQALRGHRAKGCEN